MFLLAVRTLQFLVVDMMPHVLAEQASMAERAGFVAKDGACAVGAAPKAVVLRVILGAA